MAFDFISQALADRRSQGLYRQPHCIGESSATMLLVDGRHYINFSSNDYLGMRQSTAVLQGWVDGISQFGGGSGASPLVTGHTSAHQALQDYLAEGLGREKALLFSSGFAANQGICQALMQAGSHIVADKLMHASLLDGALASKGQLSRFRHNDIGHLKGQLGNIRQRGSQQQAPQRDILLATEGVFSMDGDQGPLAELVAVADQHQAWLMVDDAHGLGVLGNSGLGSVQAQNLSQQQVPVVMGTFGKAIGTAGAFVAGSADLIDYLTNFARHYIYSTAMPPAQAVATLASFTEIKHSARRDALHNNIQLFVAGAKSAGLKLMPSDTAIQPVLIGNAQATLDASDRLKALGVWVTPIRSPTVPKGTDRLRVTLSSAHQPRDISALVDALSLVLHSGS
ncbi:MAG: 8-amino-7-oxononanoate synthase [Paraglaciecola sp.]|jgi:8-amino-7-oxononanoate synthase